MMSETAVLHAPENVAHNLARFDRRRRVREAVALQEPTVSVRQKTAALPKTKTHARSLGMSISAFAVISFAMAAGVLLLIVYSYMQVSVINSETQLLRKELASLQKAEKIYIKQIDTSMTMSEIEAYAVGTLGMVKPDSNHVIFVDLSGQDHGEVIIKRGFFESLKAAVSDWSVNVMAYLS